MIHYYIAKKRISGNGIQQPRTYKYKIACNPNEFIEPTNFEDNSAPRRWGRESKQLDFSSIPFNATCPNCLKIIIPKFEAKIAALKETLKQSLAAPDATTSASPEPR